MAADGPKLIEVTLGSAATAWCRTATSCALSGAHSSTRPVRGELGSAPRPTAGEHERSPNVGYTESEQNVNILSHLLAQLAQTSFSLLGKRGLRRAAASWSRRRDQLLRHEAIGTLRLGRPGYQARLLESSYWTAAHRIQDGVVSLTR